MPYIETGVLDAIDRYRKRQTAIAPIDIEPTEEEAEPQVKIPQAEPAKEGVLYSGGQPVTSPIAGPVFAGPPEAVVRGKLERMEKAALAEMPTATALSPDELEQRTKDEAEIRRQADEQRAEQERQFSEATSYFRTRPYYSDTEYREYQRVQENYDANLAEIKRAEDEALKGIADYYTVLDDLIRLQTEFYHGYKTEKDEGGNVIAGWFEDVDVALAQLPAYRNSLEAYRAKIEETLTGEDLTSAQRNTNEEVLDQVAGELELLAELESNPKAFMSADEQMKRMGSKEKAWQAWSHSPWYLKWTPLAALPVVMSQLPPSAIHALEWWRETVDVPYASFLWQAAKVIDLAVFGGFLQDKSKDWGGIGPSTSWEEWKSVDWAFWTDKAKQEYKQETPEWGQFMLEFANPLYWVGPSAIGKGVTAIAQLPKVLRAVPVGIRASVELAELGEIAAFGMRAAPAITANPLAGVISRYTALASRFPMIAERTPQILRAFEMITPKAALAMEPAALTARAAMWGTETLGRVASPIAKAYLAPWVVPSKYALRGAGALAKPLLASVSRELAGKAATTWLTRVGRAARQAGWELEYVAPKAEQITAKVAEIKPPKWSAREALLRRNIEPAMDFGVEKIEALVEKIKAGVKDFTPEELQLQANFGEVIEEGLKHEAIHAATGALEVKGFAQYKLTGFKGVQQGKVLYARDLGEVWTVLESGTLTPKKNFRWYNEKLYIAEADEVFARGEFVHPEMPLRGRIIETPAGTVYQSETLGKSSLNVISEAQLAEGRPAWMTPEQYDKAIEAFGKRAQQDEAIAQAMIKNPDLPDNAVLLGQRFAETRWRNAAKLIAKTKPGETVVNALNASAIDEDVVSRAAILWAEILWRGQAYRTAQMMRLYSIGRSPSIFGIRIVKTAELEVPRVTKVPLKQGIREGDMLTLRMPDGSTSQVEVSFTLGDVLQWKPTDPNCPFVFNRQQAYYLETLHQVHDDMYRFVMREQKKLERLGIEFDQDLITKTDLPESMNFVHRTTHGKVGEPEQIFHYTGGASRIGVRQSFQRGRIYDYMVDGANHGIIYGPNAEEYVRGYIDGCFKILADERMAAEVRPLGKTVAEEMERMYPGLEERLRMEKNRLAFLGGGMVTWKGQMMKVTEYTGLRQLIKDVANGAPLKPHQIRQLQKTYPELVRPLKLLERQAESPIQKELIKHLTWYKNQLLNIESRLKVAQAGRAAAERALKETVPATMSPMTKIKEAIKVMSDDLRLALDDSLGGLLENAGDQLRRVSDEIAGIKEQFASDPILNARAPGSWYYKRVGGKVTDTKVYRTLHEVLLTKAESGYVWKKIHGVRRRVKIKERLIGGDIPETITPNQYKQLTGRKATPANLDKEGRVAIHDALDEIAADLGVTTKEIVDRLQEFRPLQKKLHSYSVELENVETYMKQIDEIQKVVRKELERTRVFKYGQPLPEEPLIELGERTVTGEQIVTRVKPKEVKLGLLTKEQRTAIKNDLLDYVDVEIERVKLSLKEAQTTYDRAQSIVTSQRGKTFILEQPAFRGRMFDAEVAETIRKALATETNSWLRATSQVSGLMRTAIAALDFSAPFIHGLPIFGQDVANVMAGRPTFTWAKATKQHFQAFFSEKSYANYLMHNSGAVQEFTTKYGGWIGGSEYFEAMAEVRGIIQKAGEKVGHQEAAKMPLWVIRNSYERAERAFGCFGDAARIEMYKALKPITKSKDMYDMVQMLNVMTGVQNSKGLGIAAGQRQLESAFFFFAPRYTRAGFALCGQIFRGGVRGQYARSALGGFLGGGMVFYYGTCKALGQEMQLDPTKATFMCIRVGNQWVGPGGFYMWAMRLMSNVIASGMTSPSDLWANNRKENPFLRAFYGKLSPLSSLAVDLATKRNFIGEPIETRRDYAELLISRVAPIMLQNVIIPDDRANFPSFMAGVLGARTFPRSVWEHLNEMRNNVASSAPNLTDTQRKTLDNRGYLLWDELNWMQRNALLDEDEALRGLTDEAYAQSIERGNEYLAKLDEWRGKVDEIKTWRKEQWDTISAEYYHNMELRQKMEAGARLSPEEQQAAEEAGKRLRDRLSEVGSISSGRWDQLKLDYPDIYDSFEEYRAKGIEDEYVGDLAYEDWIKMMYESDSLYDKWGNYDFDAAELRKQEWMDKWGGPGTSVYNYVHHPETGRVALSKDEPPLLQELRKARGELRPYWELADTIAAEGIYAKDSAQAQEWAIADLRRVNPLAAQYYEAMQSLYETDRALYMKFRNTDYMRILYQGVQNMTVRTVESVLDERRLQWRRDNPGMDKWLVMFYDLSPLGTRATALG